MEFCTAINCMDGRVQLPVINYLKNRFKVDFVDTITEPGPCLILAENKPKETINSLLQRVDISVNGHGSKNLAIVGHFDCAGNPAGYEEQIVHIQKSVAFMRREYPHLQIIGLWVAEGLEVLEVVTAINMGEQ